MKVILINPSWDEYVSRKGKLINRKWPPLSLLNCAALLERNGVEVEVLDLNIAPKDMRVLNNLCHSSDKIFITSSPLYRWQCPNLDIEELIKFINGIESDEIFLTGVHGTLYPEQLLESTKAKAVIRGEPEFTVLDICQRIDLERIQGISFKRNGTLISTEKRIPVDLEKLPVPAYHLVHITQYFYELLGNKFALLETSRGCPFHCRFCLKEMYGENFRRKTIEQVIKEIKHMKALGVKNIYFIDLEFVIDRDFVLELCTEFTRQRINMKWCCQTRPDSINLEVAKAMTEAGCRLIHFGIESGSRRILDQMNKQIELDKIREGIQSTKKAGIETACFFMLGFPGETREEMRKTIDFARELNPNYASFHVAIPYPATNLFEQCESEHAFPESCSETYSPEELKEITRKAFSKFYLRPKYFLTHFSKLNVKLLFKEIKLLKEFMN